LDGILILVVLPEAWALTLPGYVPATQTVWSTARQEAGGFAANLPARWCALLVGVGGAGGRG
jgi:hypothetical protein